MEVRRRRIRISFSDPDATDSDSGEDASSASCGRKTKIVILHCSSSSSARKNPGGCGSQQRQAIRSSSASCRERAVVSSAPVMKRCRGVYERQPGRWAAEFRSHRHKARHWIGTFATEEEAKAAYDDFEKQFVPLRRCGLPLPLPALEPRPWPRCWPSQRASHPHRQRHPHPPPDTEKRQIVQALAATGITLPPLPSAPAPASAPCVSSSTSASPPPPPRLVPAPPTGFENAEPHTDDALPSVHSFWADEPADDDLVGLADLGHLPLPFSDGSMDFDPADLSLFDGFL
ncbi:unnamed protein product [Miscanthus lutarioriparius]|uniref:AP2/ERF domain-containing protein n=1 Tax=Miscanthus lutarioriparius TaxID=422564 RepID=A0A811PP30_9POAL|nr:unnamed protein product [Miscanthus lutarioriparius]